ncbi:MAG: hypothetical protein U9Q18_01260 [Caldisericota bacterium]|nr:hypothetical protein [Caldisericota bacterium]
MKKGISLIGFSIIFGTLLGWGEEAIPLLNLGEWNIIDIPFAALLFSLFLVLLFISLSKNFIVGITTTVLYVASFLGIKLFLRFHTAYSLFSQDRIIFLVILLFFSVVSIVFLSVGRDYIERHAKEISGVTGKARIDLAFPVIFFLFALLISSMTVVLEGNAILELPLFLNFLTVVVILASLLTIFSFNEISGFFIGFFSISIYFLLSRFVNNGFDVQNIMVFERVFFSIVLLYSTVFGLFTLLLGRSSRIFLFSILCKRAIQQENAIVLPSVEEELHNTEEIVEKEEVEREETVDSTQESPLSSEKDNKKNKNSSAT